MGLPDIARRIEDRFNRRGTVKHVKNGWRPSVVGFTGYGSVDTVHVLGRVIMADPQNKPMIRFPKLPTAAHSAPAPVSEAYEHVKELSEKAQRGWRQFFTTQVGFLPVTITAGDKVIETKTDRNGYIDVILQDHGLTPGWHEVTIDALAGETTTTRVLIVEPTTTLGLISDIDDTVMVTWLPRLALAAWNSWVRHTNTRQAVPGMDDFYRELLADHPNAPVFYLSTGAWNTLPTLEIFLALNNLPTGPLLLTDWGPTPTGLFRSGMEHKKTQLRNLIITFPSIKWILVGDDGQHDPLIFDELKREHPRHVAGVAIRQLNPVEQVLSHGTPDSTDYPQIGDTSSQGVPTIRGEDGYALLDEARRTGFPARGEDTIEER